MTGRTLDEVGPLLAAGAATRMTAAGGRLPGSPVAGVTADSRAVARGSVFVCLRGSRHDGHAFVSQAVRNGAVAVVAEHPLRCTRPVVVVQDARAALARLAAWYWGYPSRGLDVVGVTGTNGKTTTAYMLEAILRAAGRRPALFGTVTYRYGARAWPHVHTTADAPRLQELFHRVRAAGADAVVMEVSSHALALRRVDGVNFRAAAFTNLTRDHLDFHRTMGAYFEAKALLFAALPRAAEGGIAVVNLDDPAGARVARRTGALVLGYARRRRAAARFTATAERATAAGTFFTIREGARTVPVRLKLLGDYNVANALAAAATARGLGLGWPAIRAGLARLARVPGRMERVPVRAPFTVVVDYAHTPDALERVLGASRRLTSGRLLTVFGCGGNRDRGKRPKMGRIATERADFAWVTSDNPRDEEPQGILRDITGGIRARGRHAVVPDRRAAIGRALGAARRGDVVVIAGKGHERIQLIRGRAHPFDDVRVAREEWTRVARRGAAA